MSKTNRKWLKQREREAAHKRDTAVRLAARGVLIPERQPIQPVSGELLGALNQRKGA